MKALIGWRLLLGSAGLLLGLLPLGRGQWLAALAGGIVGLSVVGTWAWGSSGKLLGLAVGGGLVAAMVGVFAISQWPRGQLVPPAADWLGFWMLIGVAPPAVLVVEWAVRRFGWHHQPLSITASAQQASRIAVAAVLAAFLLICACGYAVVGTDNYGVFRFSARDSEVLPLPPTLRLISANSCADGGSSGNCTAEFIVTSVDGATRATTVTRLADHLRHLGWPLQVDHSRYAGCRNVDGLLPWRPHCLWLYTDAEPPPAHPEAVIIYIDNA
jgi:hypothetical protein